MRGVVENLKRRPPPSETELPQQGATHAGISQVGIAADLAWVSEKRREMETWRVKTPLDMAPPDRSDRRNCAAPTGHPIQYLLRSRTRSTMVSPRSGSFRTFPQQLKGLFVVNAMDHRSMSLTRLSTPQGIRTPKLVQTLQLLAGADPIRWTGWLSVYTSR